MLQIRILLATLLLGLARARLIGPYLIWGKMNLHNWRAPALASVSEKNLLTLFKDSKAAVVFVRNNTNQMEGTNIPKFEHLLRGNWLYFPQKSLVVEPFNYNTNVSVIALSGSADREYDELVDAFRDVVAIYGEGEVLGILANCEEEVHVLSKRENKEIGDKNLKTTMTQISLPEETDQSKIYMADGGKAILFVNAAPVLNISAANESMKLDEHNKAITFDDQRAKGYGRLNIIFNFDGEKVFLRFNFTLAYGIWKMTAVEVEYKEYRNVLPTVSTPYSVPTAPLGFSYRCSSRRLLFRSGLDSLMLNDYQIQPWLNGASAFGDAYDCVGFITPAIWAGVLISFFLLGILSVGTVALMEIKTPNRFESSRSKPLTFTVQE